MPATDQYWRKLPTMHLWFAGSAIAMGVATWMMMAKDQAQEWRDYQREANALKISLLEGQLESFRSTDYQTQIDEANDRIRAAEEAMQGRAEEKRQLESDIRSLSGQLTVAQLKAKFKSAERDVKRANFDLDIRDAKEAQGEKTLDQFAEEQAQAEQLGVVVQQIKAELDAKKAQLADITGEYDAAVAAKAQLEGDRRRVEEQLAAIDPGNPFLSKESRSTFKAVKREVKEWPILDAFNPHLKIQYDWPSLQGAHPQIQLGMARVNRVDRCRSCHVNIADSIAGAPAYPHGNPEEGKYEHPFASHPNPDLYLTSTSPHPIGAFGCTICHGGDGSGTSFQNASHTPLDPAQAEAWHKEHGWFSNHFWEGPMHPSSMVESGCLRCHHQVTELGVNSKFGASAPKVFSGFELIKDFGCYGCHPINGFDGARPIGPDLRLEPQTTAEALAIAADPNQVAGTLRKVGPSLRHIGSKVDKDFISYWTEEPKRFRPDTRMPQFFHLSNQDDPVTHAHDPDHLAELLQPVELAGIAAYLTAKSEPLELFHPKEGYQPDAERGKTLLAQRGCLACHSHDDPYFAGIKQTFGPNLTKVHEKIKPGQDGFAWLYTWLRDPQLHHPRTRMPNTFLLPEEKPDSYVDPAADIAAFLLTGGPKDFPEMPLPGVYLGVIGEKNPAGDGVAVAEVLPDSPAKRATRIEAAGGEVPSLRVGDVILSINGQAVNSAEQLNDIVKSLAAGTKVTLVIVRGGAQQEWSTAISTPLDDLVRLFLSKSLSAARLEKVFAERQFPVDDLAWAPRADGTFPDLRDFIKGDEIELAPKSQGEQVSPAEWEARKLQYIGRRTVSRYGCYGCHDVPGFEDGRPIGTALQDWGRKDTSQLAVEHIEEFLHHHGEPDGSSTARAVEEIIGAAYNDKSATHEQRMKSFFYESLLHHGRPGFIWQKLRDPRSYDYRKTETKGWDERLRMPKFPFNETQIEAIATFVLGLVADPAPDPYLYRPTGPQGAIVRGEQVLDKFNCAGCHILDMPAMQYNVNIREFVGLTRNEIVDFFSRHSARILDGALTQDMLAGRAEVPEELWPRLLGGVPEARRAAETVKEKDQLAFLSKFILNCEMLLEGQLPEVQNLQQQVAPLLARLAQSKEAVNLEQWLNEHPETLIADNISEGDYADAVRRYLRLKPPVQHGAAITKSNRRETIEFHGLQYSNDPDFGESTYDLWENLDVGGRYKLAGINSRLIVNADNPVTGEDEGRGGTFMKWLYNKLALEKAGGEPSLMMQHLYMSQQASPPPLYKEGVKVQTPWLYNFLKNPEQLRFTTVLRMPRFNMSDEEAQALADYFAAVDGTEYPYQDVERRAPDYLAAEQAVYEADFPQASDDYLTASWKLINGPTCIKCHSVGGRKFQGGGQLGPDGQPVDIRGPDLKRVQSRLRPEWAQVWLYNPKWFTPYTSMPANLPKNQQNFPELFGGDGHWQNPAVIDALMNYFDLMERIGPTVYTPPGTPATPGLPEAAPPGETTNPLPMN